MFFSQIVQPVLVYSTTWHLVCLLYKYANINSVKWIPVNLIIFPKDPSMDLFIQKSTKIFLFKFSYRITFNLFRIHINILPLIWSDPYISYFHSNVKHSHMVPNNFEKISYKIKRFFELKKKFSFTSLFHYSYTFNMECPIWYKLFQFK